MTHFNDLQPALDVMDAMVAAGVSRKMTRNAQSVVSIYQLRANPRTLPLSGGSKHKGSKSKKCKRKQQKKNKGGKK